MRRRHPRGFTLAELAITLAVSVIALAALLGMFITQQRMSSATESLRAAQEGSRRALGLLDRDLRRAGFGIDPPDGFDFSYYPAYDRPGACSTGAMAPCPRDSTTAPDQLVFVARDGDYQLGGAGGPLGRVWLYHGSTGGLQIDARGGEKFVMGRLLEVACASGLASTYVTVASTVTAAAAGTLTIPIETAGSDPWHGQGSLTTDLCYNNGADASTEVFLVDRFHYFVNSYDLGDGAGLQPWLMLDTGLDVNADGKVDAGDWLPVAEGVEDFQVDYVMNQAPGYTAPDNNLDWVFGNNAALATAETPAPTATAPQYIDPQLAPVRYDANPANIRAVRYTLVMRALQPGLKNGDPPPVVENHSATFPATGAYRRFTLTSQAATPNMESRRRFLF